MKTSSLYFVLAVVVRELSEAPECFLFDCCILIARFMSSSSYFSAKTRIQPVKSYQINKSFFSITHGVSLHIMYCLIAVLTCLHCLEHQSLPIEFTALLLSSNLNLNMNLHLNCFFSITLSHCIFVHDFPVLTLWTCKCMQVPFNICEFLQLLNEFAKPYYSPTAAS